MVKCSGLTPKLLPCRRVAGAYPSTVSLEDVRSTIARMSPEDQDQLAAYLVHLRHRRDPRIVAEMRAKIDDRKREHWLSLDALREQWKD